MKRQKKNKEKVTLREAAEEKLALSPGAFPDMKAQSTEELIHELQVHHIELSMQNEELKRANLALDSSRDRYIDLYDFAPVGYFTLNHKGLIKEVNLTGSSLLGVERKKLRNRGFGHFVANRDIDLWHLYMVNLCRHDEKQVCELSLIRNENLTFYARLESVRMEVDDETIIRIAVSDITDRKKAEEEKFSLEQKFQQTQKLESLGVLAGGIAHEFNNILMAIMGNAELVLDEIPPVSPACEKILNIEKSSRRAADLCRQMLAYAGKGTFSIERVKLGDIIREMAQLLRASISKKITLNLNTEGDVLPIRADPGQVKQIIMNLIINGAEAIGESEGIITVSLGSGCYDRDYLQKTCMTNDLPGGQYVHLHVSDTGCGMTPQTQARIFEPFFTTKFTGRGLGLSAVLGIIRAHSGAINVYSEPGNGSTFKILFPALRTEEEISPRVSALDSGWRGSGTILLVDDEPSLLDIGSKMLQRLGFTVMTAEDGRKAVEIYSKRGSEISLVLLDLTMPHMDGVEAFGKLRSLNPEVLIILTSGYSEQNVISKFAGSRLVGYIQKPYSLGKIQEILSGLLPERK